MLILSIYIAFMLLMAVLAVWRPAVVLGVVLCNYGIQQWTQSQDPLFVYNLSLTNYGTAALLIFAILVKFIRGQRPLANYPPAGWLSLALFALALASYFWSVYPEGTLDVWQQAWRTVLIFLVLTPLLISDHDDLRTGFISALTIGAIMLTLLMTTSRWEGRFVKWSVAIWSQNQRLDSGNPLAIASMAGYVVVSGILLNFVGIGRFWQFMRWAVILLGLAVSVRAARGQAFALAAVFIAFVPMSRRLRSVKGFLASSLAIFLLLAAAYWAYEEFGDVRRWDYEKMISDYQGGRIRTALILLSNWLSGTPINLFVGLGSSASYDPRILGLYPHFVALEVLGELGLVGFTLFLLILFLATRSIIRLHRQVWRDPLQRGTLAALAALFAFEVLMSCKQGSMLGNLYLFAFAIMLGRWELSMRRRSAPGAAFEEWNSSPQTWPAQAEPVF